MDSIRSNQALVAAMAAIGAIAVAAIGFKVVVADEYGDSLDALNAIPADVGVVLVADFQEIRDVADSELFDYAMEAARDAGELPPGGSLVDVIESELGIDVDEDILSWLGRSAAIGVGGDLTASAPEMVIFSAYVRDEASAWDFIDLVFDRTLRDDPAAVAGETTVGGHRVRTLLAGEDNAHFGVRDGRLVIADGLSSMEAAYATLDGESPAALDSEWVATIDRLLTNDAYAEVMVNPAFMASFADMAAPEVADAYEAFQGFGLGVSLDDTQIEFEGVAAYSSDVQQQPFAPLPIESIAALDSVPQMLIGADAGEDFGDRLVEGLDGVVAGLGDLGGSGTGEMTVDDVRQMSREFLGVDVIDGILSELSGEIVLGMWDFGSLGPQVAAHIGLRDADKVAGTIDQIRSFLELQGMMVGGGDGLIVIEDVPLVVGVRDGELVAEFAQAAPSENSSADAANLEWLEANFPDGVVAFADVGGLVAAADPSLTVTDEFESIRFGATVEVGDTSTRVFAILDVDPKG